MTNDDNIHKARDPWSTGYCDTYACVILERNPTLRLGVAGISDEDGWFPKHYFAHDDTFAYDSKGKHPLPYHGINNDFDVVELNQTVKDWGLPDTGGDPDAALVHIRKTHPDLVT